MAASDIVIKGAREHNLRDVNLVLPRNQLICLTGVSGSGKSSLAFDTLYAEGQRRYVESLSTFARQFLGQMPKPDVDSIEGLSPSISISQKSSGQNPRSTVGTITEIYDYLRVLYARCGQGHCPKCGRPITAQTREQIIAQIEQLPEGVKFSILAPLIRGQKGEHRDLFVDLLKQGFARARVDGRIVSLSDDLKLDRQMRHNIEVVVDRLVAGQKNHARLAEAVELALKVGGGTLMILPESEAAQEEVRNAEFEMRNEEQGALRIPNSEFRIREASSFSADYACTHCHLSFEPPTPQLFSFNSPQGMCLTCGGLGESYTFSEELLISDPAKSFQQGCCELIGTWRELGRWRRHTFEGVAETLERKHQLEPGTILETTWEDLDPRWQHALLWGTGDLHITFSWKHGGGEYKYGGKWEGIIPELIGKHRGTKSGMQQRQLEEYMSVVPCGACQGERLNPQARAVQLTTRHPRFAGAALRSLPGVCGLSVAEAVDFFSELELDSTRQVIAAEVLKEIRGRLGFLLGVGLDYLSLDRTAPTLSGGESQRIRLAGQIGCGLVGVLYILDEPSIGLHPRDNDRLLGSLTQLRDLGNTVVVVEHDEETMRAADHIIDFGPGPGVRGGEVVAEGHVDELMRQPKSLTGQFLAGHQKIEIPAQRRPVGEEKAECGVPSAELKAPKNGKSAIRNPQSPIQKRASSAGNWLTVVGAAHNNLKGVDIAIPLGALVCVTGVSGSGKSSLVNDILSEALLRDLNRGDGQPGRHERIDGLEHLDKLIAIDQSPIGRTPRSNPATYIKVFDEIRRLYTRMPDSKTRGYKEGRFSFNVSGGRCEACEGNGSNRLEMDFLADVWVTCPICQGHRFNRETLQIQFKEKSISDVLEMDVQQALEHFENIPVIRHKLQTLHDVGLDYLKLGQPSPTLSGGEAQRIKLARELVKRSTGKTLYLLDEPTTGLHFADIKLLLKVLHNFVDQGNTVLVVEHNLDVVKTADWVIDLGPEGGAAGGHIVAAGTPEQVAAVEESYTGLALRKVLGMRNGGNGEFIPKSAIRIPHSPITSIKLRGARQHNLKNLDLEIPRDQMTVFCGPSGSGKSSLAMDTIYAEGQRRYVESLSSYARQFVAQMQKPQLEHIEGLSPAIAIEQKNMGHTPRSTVGTVTEIYDYLRILLARLGQPHCPDCDIPIGTQTTDQIVDKILAHEAGTKLYLLAPQEIEVGEAYDALWEQIRAGGYARVRIDGQTHSLDTPPTIDRRRKHQVEVVVDRIAVKAESRGRIADSVEHALVLGKGVVRVAYADEAVAEPNWETRTHSVHFACEQCGRSFEPLTPHNFSFNSPLGWCPSCQGLGMQTGTNPAALLRDPKLSLAEGAVALWPDLVSPLARAMLTALCEQTGIPRDVPFEKLSARHRRIIFHGCGEQWINVNAEGGMRNAELKSAKKNGGGKSAIPNSEFRIPNFKFQFKGLYPALEEATRLTAWARGKLEHLVAEIECANCNGSRLRDDAAAVKFRGRTLDQLCRTPLGELLEQVSGWKLTPRDRKIAGELVREVRNRMQFLVDVGLDYLTLGRPGPTLSGGESQRIRLASQVGSGLTGVLYVLDEPTIGLHPRDNRRLIKALARLRDLGNTLLLVEHDKEVVESADHLLDFGPAAGQHGGEIVAQGPPALVAKSKTSVTGPFLSGKKAVPVPKHRRIADCGLRIADLESDGTSPSKKKLRKSNPKSEIRNPKSEIDSLEVLGARHNNLKSINARIPLGALTVVTGVSGSGKSSLVNDVLYTALARKLHRIKGQPGAHDKIVGLERIDKVIQVDQQALGNTPTSNPATYTGVFELIRALFAQLPDAKLRGYTPRRFSFNVPGGRCERCEGNGQLRIEMHFLPDVWVECDTCRGQRYNPETLAVRFHGHTIADVLSMPIGKAAELFQNIPDIRRILRMLCDVGFDYLTLGQSAPTLSGGEAQRVKLAAELARPDTGRTLYLLDEPTTGLHFSDLIKLLEVMNRLVDLGNTVVVIEHNLDVIKTADWIIDLGPEAGDSGGQIVYQGTPEGLAAHAAKASEQVRVSAPSESAPSGGAPSKKKSSPARKNPVAPAVKSPAELPLLRSYTGEALAPVLAAGPLVEREVYDPAAAEKKRASDLDISEVGREAQMPWESAGRQWHTVDRVGRSGEPCRWDGQIVARVVDRIHELGTFSPTDWNDRTRIEIAAERKSDGWFFHAITGEQWIVRLKFRVAKKSFQREKLVEQLALKPFDELPDLPIYGSQPRVKCKNIRGPWQEIELAAHELEEIDRSEFWEFLESAVAGFRRLTERVAQNPDDVMPWKVLGQKWHFSRRGFPPGKKVHWPPELLEELCELLSETAPGGQFLWNNQQVVHLFVPQQSEPWASVYTKRVAGLDLVLHGPKNRFAFGRVAGLGAQRELVTEDAQRDAVKLRFHSPHDLQAGNLSEFLEEHFSSVNAKAHISGK